MLEALLDQWGYLAIALGTFVEGEAVLLCAGALAHSGRLSLPLVILAATAGSLSWGQTWFWVGRKFGRAFIARRPSLRERTLRVELWLLRYGGWVVVGFRFIAGMAIVLPVLVAACGYRPRRFLFLDAVGAVIWASAFAAAGLGMGLSVEKILERPIGWSELVAIGVAGVLFVWLMTRLVSAALTRPKSAKLRCDTCLCMVEACRCTTL
jgi:membrane protein DedA with SNARE-associated domain